MRWLVLLLTLALVGCRPDYAGLETPGQLLDLPTPPGSPTPRAARATWGARTSVSRSSALTPATAGAPIARPTAGSPDEAVLISPASQPDATPLPDEGASPEKQRFSPEARSPTAVQKSAGLPRQEDSALPPAQGTPTPDLQPATAPTPAEAPTPPGHPTSTSSASPPTPTLSPTPMPPPPTATLTSTPKPATPAATPAGPHRFVVSREARKYYYCDTDPAWRGLSPKNLIWYDNEEQLRRDWPKLILHEPCK